VGHLAGFWKFTSRPSLTDTPACRQAAKTLAATRRQRSANWQSGDNEVARPVKPLEQEKTFNKMSNKSNFSTEAAVANCSGAMEAETIQKNEASLKSHKSRGNFLFYGILLLAFCGFGNKAMGQSWNLTNGTLTISDNGAFSSYPYPWANNVNAITKLIIGNGVTSIPYTAFSDCKYLQNVNIEDSPVSLSLPQGSFYWYTFSGCPIQTLYLGRDLNPNDGAVPPFAGITSLSTLTIGNDVTNIGRDYFSGCSGLTAVTIPNSVIEISDGAFNGCEQLKTLIIGNSVTTIGQTSFQNCKVLQSVTIPKSVTQIGDHAFNGCIKLANVIIEDSPISLKLPQGSFYWYTFAGCPIQILHLGRDLDPNDGAVPPFAGMTSLSTLTIGDKVTNIGRSYFDGCIGLTQISSNATTPPTLQSNTFNNVSRNINVIVPCGCLNAYKANQYWNTFTKMNDGGCTGIENVAINQLNIYPNPTKDEIYIKTDLQIKKIEICDISGHHVEMRHATFLQNGVQTISISNLAQGVYIVKIYTDNDLIIRKIVKE